MADVGWFSGIYVIIRLVVVCMKIRELLEGNADASDPLSVRPTTHTGVMPVPGNFVTPVLAPVKGPMAPTPISPVSSTNPGGPPTAMDMRNIPIQDGLPTAMGTTAGASLPAGAARATSTPDLPVKRNM